MRKEPLRANPSLATSVGENSSLPMRRRWSQGS